MAMERELDIAVVGGSITGCCAAIILERAGHHVTVFERSLQGLVGRGGGIGTIAPVFDSLIADDLLDPAFPHVPISKLAFTAGRSTGDRVGVSPWQAPMDFRSFHWSALWNGLRSRVPDSTYRGGHEVVAVISNGPDGASLRLADGAEHAFDLVLFADGYLSLGRSTLFPDQELSYRGYLLWRGLLPEDAMEDSSPIGDSIVRLSYLDMPGDLVMYMIPREDGSTRTGERVLNWAAYVPMPEENLAAFMVDRRGELLTSTIPPGRMRPEAESDLKELVCGNLPGYYADIIRATTGTYVQLIYNIDVPDYARGRVCLLGDAGMVVQPFTGSGVFKGLNNVRDLLKALQTADTLDESLAIWSADQVRVGRRLLALGLQMEDALIWNRLDFASADAATTETWWRSAVTWPDEFSLESS